MTSEVAEERGESAYFMPIPAAKKRSQIHFETAIYLTEAASKFNDAWIANELREFADDATRVS